MSDALDDIWRQVTTVQSPPTWWVTALSVLVGLALVVPFPVWRVTRNVVTIAHEGGHAIVAVLFNRRLDGIRLHSDTSGVTVSAGKPTGLGMILTAFAGYVAPSLIGLGSAVLLARGRALLALWVLTALLLLMLVMIRNVYGALTVIVTGSVVFAVSWWAPNATQALFASALTWFLLVAGPLPVWELQRKRKYEGAADSDVDQLSRLTGLPGTVWVFVFGAVTLVCPVYALSQLISG